MFWLCVMFTNRLDDESIEKMSLLQTVTESHLVTGRTNDANILDEKIVPLKCPRCGFVNTKASLVCKECNTLLKDNGLFSQKKALQFYSYVYYNPVIRCNHSMCNVTLFRKK